MNEYGFWFNENGREIWIILRKSCPNNTLYNRPPSPPKKKYALNMKLGVCLTSEEHFVGKNFLIWKNFYINIVVQ